MDFISFIGEKEVTEKIYKYCSESPGFKKLVSSETFVYAAFAALKLSGRVDMEKVSTAFFGNLLTGYKVRRLSDVPQYDYSEGFPGVEAGPPWFAGHLEFDVLVAEKDYPPKSTIDNIGGVYFRKKDIAPFVLEGSLLPPETAPPELIYEDVAPLLISEVSLLPPTEPLIQNNHIYKIEIRQDKGVDVYFESEKSLVIGRPSEFLLTLIAHQSQQIDFRFFSNKGEGGQTDYESGLYAEDIYEPSDTNFKPYQKSLDALYAKKDFAIEKDNRAQIDSVISEITKFETDIVKKTLSGFVDDDGQITRGRKKLKREFEKEINRLVKQKANLLKQLKPNTKAHFDESLNTGTKLSYSPKHPTDWKIIQ